jgi:hypothetical protein
MSTDDIYVPPQQLRARIDLLRRSGREIESVIDGASMEPAILSGARIRIEPRTALPSVGTTVAIVTPGGLVAHRLAARGSMPWNRRFVLTQGDGLVLCDPPVPIELILGPVTARHQDEEWRAVPPRSPLARAVTWRSSLWRTVVRLALALHPRLAAALVRISLRGRVSPVRWVS